MSEGHSEAGETLPPLPVWDAVGTLWSGTDQRLSAWEQSAVVRQRGTTSIHELPLAVFGYEALEFLPCAIVGELGRIVKVTEGCGHAVDQSQGDSTTQTICWTKSSNLQWTKGKRIRMFAIPVRVPKWGTLNIRSHWGPTKLIDTNKAEQQEPTYCPRMEIVLQ